MFKLKVRIQFKKACEEDGFNELGAGRFYLGLI